MFLLFLLLYAVVIVGEWYLFLLPLFVFCTVFSFGLWFEGRLVVCVDADELYFLLDSAFHFVSGPKVCCVMQHVRRCPLTLCRFL